MLGCLSTIWKCAGMSIEVPNQSSYDGAESGASVITEHGSVHLYVWISMRWLQLSLTLIRFSEEPRKSSYTFLTIYEGSSCETFQGCCRIKCHPHPVEGPFTYPGTKVPGTLEDLGPDGDGRPECDAPQSAIIYNTPELILPARCDTSVCLSENGLSEILRTRTAQHKLFVPPKEDQNRRGRV